LVAFVMDFLLRVASTLVVSLGSHSRTCRFASPTASVAPESLGAHPQLATCQRSAQVSTDQSRPSSSCAHAVVRLEIHAAAPVDSDTLVGLRVIHAQPPSTPDR